VSFFATGRKLSGRNGKRFASPGLSEAKTTNPKQERKSYYERQKKYPDLYRRRSRHSRDLGEFIAGRAAASLPRKADARRVRLMLRPNTGSAGVRVWWYLSHEHRCDYT